MSEKFSSGTKNSKPTKKYSLQENYYLPLFHLFFISKSSLKKAFFRPPCKKRRNFLAITGTDSDNIRVIRESKLLVGFYDGSIYCRKKRQMLGIYLDWLKFITGLRTLKSKNSYGLCKYEFRLTKHVFPVLFKIGIVVLNTYALTGENM